MRVAVGPYLPHLASGQTRHIGLILDYSEHDVHPILPHPLSLRYRRHTRALEMYLRRHRIDYVDLVGLFRSHVTLPRNEVIHLHGGVLWPELYYRPAHSSSRYVYTMHWLHDREDYLEEEWHLIDYYNELMFRVCERSDVVVTVSRWMRDALQDRGINATVIPPGIDTDACLSSSPSRFALKYKINPGFILWTGWLQNLKRPHWLWRLARHLPEERIVAVVGASTRQLEGQGLLPIPQNIRMLGYMPHQDFLDALSASAVFVSTTRREAYGLAVAEAIACGTLPVASRLGGPAEFVTPGVTGELYDPGSFDDFEEQVARAMERGRVKPEAGTEFAHSHSAERVVRRLDTIYSS